MSKRIKLIENSIVDNIDNNNLDNNLDDDNHNLNLPNNLPNTTFFKKFDDYGRLLFAYNLKDYKSSSIEHPGKPDISRGILHKYTTSLNTTDITFFIPNVSFIGEFVIDGESIAPAGQVRVFHSNALGQQLIYSGIMHKNDFIHGTLFGENNTKKFQGTFKNNLFHYGTMFHCNGSVRWKGPFQNGIPHGVGDFYTFTDRFIKAKMHEGSLTEGTVYKNDLIEYKGSFKNTDFHGRGIFFPHGQTIVPYERYIGEFANGVPLFCLWETVSLTNEVPLTASISHKIIYKYAGGFNKRDKKIVFHGAGALFFKLPNENMQTKLIKWVGRFNYGHRIGIFRIYMTDETDPLLSVSSITNWSEISEYYKFSELEYGTLMGTTCFVDNVEMGSIEVYKLGKLVYEGAGVASPTELVESIFIKDGEGTQYNSNTGKPEFEGWWIQDELKIVETLYDDNGNKLFELEDGYCYTLMAKNTYEDDFVMFMDSAKRWPLLNGPGNVYAADGTTVLYHTNMNNGILEEIPDITVEEYAINENKITDYVTLDQLKRGYFAISFNGDEDKQHFVSMNTFSKLVTDVPLKDPLRGSYPGYRFKKFKLV